MAHSTLWHRIVGVVIGLAFLAAMPAAAHEIRPAIVTVSFDTKSGVAVLVSLNLEALIAGVGPEHKDTNDAPEAATYNALRASTQEALQERFVRFSGRWIDGLKLEIDGTAVVLRVVDVLVPVVGDLDRARISTVRLAAEAPPAAKHIRWSYGAEYGSVVLRVQPPQGAMIEGGWLKDGQPSRVIALVGEMRASPLANLLSYVAVGFTHIVPKGLDHILFVLGLYLLSVQWRPLLAQVTAFTVAHSLTLALGLYGILEVSPSVVEPLIALSIVYVAVENLMTAKLHVWRPVIVFGFGLLHGLGFAGVLQEIGLPRTDYVSGLIGFNVGVELGQLSVIAAAWLVTGLWFSQKSWYRQRVVWPASLAIALVGLFWTIERVWFS